MARSFPGGAGTDKIVFSSQSLATTQRSMFIAFYVVGLDAVARRVWDFTRDLLIVTSAFLQFNVSWSIADTVWQTVSPVSTDTWHYLAISYDGSSTANDPVMYLDGSPLTVLDSTSLGTLVTSAADLNIGNRADNIRCFNGHIAEYGRWNRLLSVGEMQALSKGYSPRFFQRGLVFYAPLMGKISPENNLSGSGTGTVSGTSAIAHPRIIYPRN